MLCKETMQQETKQIPPVIHIRKIKIYHGQILFYLQSVIKGNNDYAKISQFLLCVLHRFLGICYVSATSMFMSNHLSRLYLKQCILQTYEGETIQTKHQLTLSITKIFFEHPVNTI